MKHSGTENVRAALSATLLAAVLASTPVAAVAQELEEIIVSARKKDESVQKVPVAVTAITSSMIEQMNIVDLDDIAKYTAGLVFDPEFNRTSNRPVIRGQANILGDSGVSYFIDGVYITGSINDYDINDVERIEVVKGPQSALYGRNTYSGAINIVTKSPGDSLSGRVQGRVSDDDQREISATIKGPVSDTFSAGITGRYYKLDGPFTNTFDGSVLGEQESKSLSAVGVLNPNARFSARARVYFSETRDGQPALFAQDASDNNCFIDNGTLYGGDGRYYCGVVQPRNLNTDWRRQVPDARDDRDILQASVSLDFVLNDRWSLTSITGYNKEDADFVIDGDYAPTSFQTANFTPGGFPYAGFPIPPFTYGWIASVVDFTFAGNDDISDISQELRLNFSGDRSEFLIGAYYFDQENKSSDIRVLPADGQALADANVAAENAAQEIICGFNPVCGATGPIQFGPMGIEPFDSTVSVPRDRNDLDISNIALFGMAAFDINDQARLTIEGRWQEEEIEQRAVIQDLGGAAGDPITASATFTSFNPRVTFDYQLTDSNLLYVLAAQGNKPGGFNSTVAIEAGLPTYDEEEVISIEAGSKNVAADGQFVANIAVYFNQIEGYQLTQNARAGSNTTSAIINAGDADILGAEIEMLLRPKNLEGLTLTFNYAYTDTEFTEGTDENFGVLLDAEDNGLVDCSTGDQFPSTPPDPTECNASLFGSIVGKQIPRTAEHQVFFDGEIRRPVGAGDWEWYLGANFSYESSKFAQVTNFTETGSASLVGARLGIANDRYAIGLWGRNLTGEDSTPLVLRYADGADSFKRSFVGTMRRDTYYGVIASAQF